MSQKTNTNLLLPEPSQELIVSEPWTIETYADGLMDELFADIDCILDGSGNLSSQIVQAQQQLLLDKAKLPQIVAPPTIISPIQEAEQPHISLQFNTVASKPPKTTRIPKKKPRSRIWRNIVQLVSLGAGLGLAIAAMNWAINNGLLNRLTSKSLQFSLQEPALQQEILQAENSAPTQAQIKSDLVDYMLGALAIIDRQQQESQDRVSVNNIARRIAPVPANQATLAYANQPTANLPRPRIVNNAKPLPTRTTRVVERIYIPVYQAPQPMRYAPPPVAQAPLPPVKTANKGVAPKASDKKAKKVAKAKPPEKITAFASIRKIEPVAVKAKPVNVRQTPKLPKIKEPASIPASKQTAAAPATSAAPVQKKGTVVASAPKSSHVLEGLLELGEQSAALFKVNGITRRVQKGESIGASGWKLVEVANGEAIIRRNGEVRSIFAGQKF